MSVHLCEKCFPAWCTYELHPIGTALLPCEQCGTYDQRQQGGVKVITFPQDPRKENSMLKFIIISGDPVNGFNFYGPFEFKEDAIKWAEILSKRDWWLSDLMEPD